MFALSVKVTQFVGSVYLDTQVQAWLDAIAR
jgi:hypothetical protein